MSPTLLTVAIIMAFSMWAPMFTIPPMENILLNALSLSRIQTSLLFSGPVLMLALAALPGGRLADRAGIKKVAGIGAIIIVIGAALRGFSDNYTFLLISTMIYGLGLGTAFPNLPKLVRGCSPRELALFYLGILVGGVLLAGAISISITLPFVYPITNTYNGVFLIWSLPPLVAAILWWILIKEPPCEVPAPPQKSGGGKPQGILPVLKNPKMLLIALTFLTHNFFLYSLAGLLPAFLEQKGASADQSGVITSVIFWIGIPTVILIPWFSRKVSIQRKLFVWIPSLILIITSWLIIDISLFWSWFLMILIGIVATLRFITILTMPVEVMPPEQAGTASGVNISIAYFGALAGPLVSGAILSANGNYTTVFLILMGVSAITALMGLFLPPVTSKK